MKIPRNVSGAQLADHICRNWDYMIVRQVGSHIMLRTPSPSSATQVIPAHSPLRIGTLTAILGQIARHKQVSREDILRGL